MFRFFIIILIAAFTLINLQGCSFITEKLGIKLIKKEDKQYLPEEEQTQEKKSEPIPTNPNHS